MDNEDSMLIQFLDEKFGGEVKKLDNLNDIYAKASEKKKDLVEKVCF